MMQKRGLSEVTSPRSHSSELVEALGKGFRNSSSQIPKSCCFLVLGFELRAYNLIHSTRPFF
jgi:hypothetical protein